MIRRSRPPQPESRHRAAPRFAWTRLVAPAPRAGVVAVGVTLVLVGLVVVAGLAGDTGRFTPLPLPRAGDAGAGTAGSPAEGQPTGPDPETPSASSSPTPRAGGPTSSASPRTAAAQSAGPGPVGQQPTPSSPPSTLDTSVKHPAHHGKPPWSVVGPHDGKPDVSP